MSAVTIVCRPETGRLARNLRSASDSTRPVSLSHAGATDACLDEAADRYPDAVVAPVSGRLQAARTVVRWVSDG